VVGKVGKVGRVFQGIGQCFPVMTDHGGTQIPEPLQKHCRLGRLSRVHEDLPWSVNLPHGILDNDYASVIYNITNNCKI
jgi:hypothetical protein